MTDRNEVLLAALEFRAAGVSVVAVREDGSKAPAGSWKQYQTRLATPDEIVTTIGTASGFGIVTGAISGGLEMLELEGRAVAAGCLTEARDLAYASGLDDVWEMLASTYIEQTPSGGIHWLYRIADAPVPGNTKLARRPGENGGVDVLAETRGEGGFVVVAPSHGTVHASGEPWTRLNQSTPSSIKTLTSEQRDALHVLFRALDQMPAAEETAEHVAAMRDTDGSKPGDDFNTRTSWREILEPLGWHRVYQRGAETYWRRPGKDHGISASTGRNDADNLFVWTTSTVFEAERPISKFAAVTQLRYGGDFAAAARDLRRLGYGTPAPTPAQPATTLTPLKSVLEATQSGATSVLAESTDDDIPDAEIVEKSRFELLFDQELEQQQIRRAVKQHLDENEQLANFRAPVVVRSAADELAQPDEDTDWTVFELMPRGANVLLTAAYKSGKTTLVNNLVRSLVDQEPFLARYGVEPHDGRVVIFNYEVEPRQYRQWLRDMNIQNLDKITLVHLRGLRMPVTSKFVEDQIVAMLTDYQCETWIVDPFARAFVGSGEENSNSDVARFLDTLDVIKDRAGVRNLILPAHTGRAQEQGVERARGATRLDDHADARWLLTKNTDGDRFFSASGRDVEVEEQLLTFERDSRRMSIGKKIARHQHSKDKLADRILDYVRDNQRCSSRDIKQAVGGNSADFADARRQLETAGLIRYDEIGPAKLWSTTDVRPFQLAAGS